MQAESPEQRPAAGGSRVNTSSLCHRPPAGTTGKAPSPPPLLTDRQVNEKVENLSIQLRLMTRERNELRKRLAFATHGTTFDKRWRPCPSPAGPMDRVTTLMPWHPLPRGVPLAPESPAACPSVLPATRPCRPGCGERGGGLLCFLQFKIGVCGLNHTTWGLRSVRGCVHPTLGSWHWCALACMCVHACVCGPASPPFYWPCRWSFGGWSGQQLEVPGSTWVPPRWLVGWP